MPAAVNDAGIGVDDPVWIGFDPADSDLAPGAAG